MCRFEATESLIQLNILCETPLRTNPRFYCLALTLLKQLQRYTVVPGTLELLTFRFAANRQSFCHNYAQITDPLSSVNCILTDTAFM